MLGRAIVAAMPDFLALLASGSSVVMLFVVIVVLVLVIVVVVVVVSGLLLVKEGFPRIRDGKVVQAIQMQKQLKNECIQGKQIAIS